MTSNDTKIKSGNRRELLLLVLVFGAPFIAAWVVYNFTNFGGNGNSSNYGDLISPPLKISDLSLRAVVADGDRARLYGKWSLIYITPEACLSNCQEDIRILRNMRPALANNSARLQTAVAVESPGFAELTANFPEDFNWNGIFIVNSLDLRKAIEDDDTNAKDAPVLEPGFYLVDPMGNMMMRYNPGGDGAGILGDLKRLLRYSRIG